MDYDILEWVAYYLDAGYSLSIILELLIHLTGEKRLIKMDAMLKQGISVKQAFLNLEIDPLWKEYFSLYSQTCSLSIAIRKSQKLLEIKNNFVKEIKKKLTYPMVLLIFSFIFAFFISVYLIPQLYILYASFEQTINPLILIYFNLLSKIPIVFFVFCIGFISYVLKIIRCIRKGNFNYLNQIGKNTWLKKSIKIYLSIKFALYYKETISISTSTKQALNLLQKDHLQKDLKMLIYVLNESITAGYSITKAVKKCNYFDSYFCQLFEMSIKSNQVEKTMELYVNSMMKIMKQKMDKILKIIIPCIYIYSAGSVVSIYFLIIIPIMNLVDQF